MAYTVHEVAKMSGVTIKTLYHYQKINLLEPERIADNGYRLYGDKELERLQQILFYRELDFPLESIKTAMQNETSRLRCLCEQRSLLRARQQRTENILHTLEQSILCAEKGVFMSKEIMFEGLNKKEWENSFSEQNKHLQKNYDFEIDTDKIDAEVMNESAKEAMSFMAFMANSLKNGVSVGDKSVFSAVEGHIKALNIDANGFAAQSKFLMTDDFHRQMLEGQQIGLSYYICFAAETYASK